MPQEFSILNKSVEKFNQHANIANADSLFSLLFRFALEQEDVLNEKLYALENFDDLNSLIYANKENYTQAALDFQTEMKRQNIKIGASEGSIYLIFDFYSISENIKAITSDQTDMLIDLLIQERENPCAEDGGIVIPLNSVADRVIAWEKQLSALDLGIMEDVKKERYSFYLNCLFVGLDNTPASFNDGKIQQDFINAYEYMIATYSGFNSTEIISNYYNLLKQNNFQLNDEIRK